MIQMDRKPIWIFNHYEVKPDIPGGTRYFDFGEVLVKTGFMVKYLREDMK